MGHFSINVNYIELFGSNKVRINKGGPLEEQWLQEGLNSCKSKTNFTIP